MIGESGTRPPIDVASCGKREVAIDVLRGLALLVMAASHCVRGVLDSSFRQVPAEAPRLDLLVSWTRAWLLTIEPYVSSLFLTLAGFAMVLVFRKSADRPFGKWCRPRVRRAVELMLISWVIFWVHGGIQLPWHPFVSAEILYNFSVGILLCLPLVRPSVWRWPALVAVVVGGVVFVAFAEGHPDLAISRLAQGPGAHFPNALFLPLGVALGEAWLRDWRWLKPGLAAAGLVIVVAYQLFVIPGAIAELAEQGVNRDRATVMLDAPFGRAIAKRRFITDGKYGSTYDLKWLAHKVGVRDDAPRRKKTLRAFWNKRARAVPYLVGLMMLTLGLAGLPFWRRSPRWLAAAASPLALMGRHSLKIYVFHLMLVALSVAALGRMKSSPDVAAAVTAGIIAACVVLAWFVERRPRDAFSHT